LSVTSPLLFSTLYPRDMTLYPYASVKSLLPLTPESIIAMATRLSVTTDQPASALIWLAYSLPNRL
jgi:hypothetical protein